MRGKGEAGVGNRLEALKRSKWGEGVKPSWTQSPVSIASPYFVLDELICVVPLADEGSEGGIHRPIPYFTSSPPFRCIAPGLG